MRWAPFLAAGGVAQSDRAQTDKELFEWHQFPAHHGETMHHLSLTTVETCWNKPLRCINTLPEFDPHPVEKDETINEKYTVRLFDCTIKSKTVQYTDYCLQMYNKGLK